MGTITPSYSTIYLWIAPWAHQCQGCLHISTTQVHWFHRWISSTKCRNSSTMLISQKSHINLLQFCPGELGTLQPAVKNCTKLLKLKYFLGSTNADFFAGGKPYFTICVYVFGYIYIYTCRERERHSYTHIHNIYNIHIILYISGQISIIPKPELRDFGEVPLLNHHLGWPRLTSL